MPRKTHTFSLCDRDGLEHQYRVTEHPTDEGFDLQLELAEIVASIPAVIVAFIDSMEEGSAADPVALGSSMQAIPRAVMQAGGSKIMVRILKYAERKPEEAGEFQKLTGQLARDEAYSGNFGELYRAIWEVIQRNFDPFSMVSTDKLKEAWAKLQTWLPQEDAEELTTE